MKVLKKNEDRFTSRGFGRGLGTLAKISKTQKKKKDVREFLAEYVNHPKTTVRTSAIRALGTLGDELAMPVIQAFTDSNESSVSRAAKDAIGSLRDNKPSAPREVIELRKEIADLKKSNKKLGKTLEDIKEQLKAQAKAAEEDSKAEDKDKKDK